ncbi:MAG TPA: hypothetical protein VNU92_12220 [Edaphobacter sp.]|nr:hypothetical protein [Edaphobacter sp.]
MTETKPRPGLRATGCAAGAIFLSLMMVGCRGRSDSFLGRFRHDDAGAPKQGEVAERGRAEIVEECGKQSYETAKKGLIVSEVGLHEDVFMLRDLVTYGGIGYSLDEALRLEALLQDQIKDPKLSAEQSFCIRKFAEHLESLSDPLIERDQQLKQLDASAFEDSTKEAERQTAARLRAEEKTSDARGPRN